MSEKYKRLAPIQTPWFLKTLNHPFHTQFNKAITAILNAKGNSVTARSRDLEWHNNARLNDGKRNRQLSLIAKFKELHVIATDYETMARRTPELIDDTVKLIEPRQYRDDMGLFRLLFSAQTYKAYLGSIGGEHPNDEREIYNSYNRKGWLVDTNSMEPYQVHSLSLEMLDDYLNTAAADEELSKLYPIYEEYTPKEKYPLLSNHDSFSNPNSNSHSQPKDSKHTNSAIAKVLAMQSNFISMVSKDFEKLSQPHDIMAMCTVIDNNLTTLIQMLRGTNQSNQPQPQPLPPPKPVPPTQPSAKPDKLPSDGYFWNEVSESALVRSELSHGSNEQIQQPVVTPQPLPSVINADIAAKLNALMNPPVESTSFDTELEIKPKTYLDNKPVTVEHLSHASLKPTYDSLFQMPPVPASQKLYGYLDFAAAGFPGGNFAAWCELQKVSESLTKRSELSHDSDEQQDAADDSSNHTSH